jgi:hypothetical protein
MKTHKATGLKSRANADLSQLFFQSGTPQRCRIVELREDGQPGRYIVVASETDTAGAAGENVTTAKRSKTDRNRRGSLGRFAKSGNKKVG